MGRIVDGFIAYINLNGDGPTELLTYEQRSTYSHLLLSGRKNHLSVVLEGGAFLVEVHIPSLPLEQYRRCDKND